MCRGRLLEPDRLICTARPPFALRERTIAALGKATSVLALLAGGAMARYLHSDLDATATLVGGSRALALVGAAVTASVHAVARRAWALGFVPEDEPGPSNNGHADKSVRGS